MTSCLIIAISLFDDFGYAQIVGSAYGTRQNRRFTFTGKINLRAGTNRIALLNIAMGLSVSRLQRLLNLVMPFFFLLDRCFLIQVGIKGEAMNIVSPNGISFVEWTQAPLFAQKQQPLTWYKVKFQHNKIYST
ncbi:hypothetical protein GIB67_011138 [Kingdonia uniflora]|uniref:Uncharacterized protein n=1 Tax=Kingdonia uniflora TaxID=39325 RepID=A0A7J7PAA8_9MAGN|nr:hypothetical protein GIB67_011138 [Kingdonia uniflora]